MKGRLLIVCTILAFIGLGLPGIAAADWTENFDSYVAGSPLHGQGGWHGWDGSAAATGYVSTLYSRSTPNSVDISGPADMVHEYTGYTSGPWVYTAWMYVPGNFSGQTYFLLLNQYNDFGPYNWSTQVIFDSATRLVSSDPEGTTLPLVTDQWVEIRVEIDLDLNQQTFFYGGQLLTQKSWTEGVSGGGLVNIGAVDLFANGATSVFYDDMSLLPPNPTPAKDTSWGKVKQSFR